MKKCELCKIIRARTYCESDEASLCWECDAKVHGANFLVARHSRTLLCHACQSPTPWKASGVHLGKTFSVCRTCDEGEESEGANDTETDSDATLGDDDGDNQQILLSSTTTPPPQPSSSSSDESVSNTDVSESLTTVVSSKRRRAHHNSQDYPSPTDAG